ncbi:MAG TPA: hypothetical protein DCP96_00040, partial [Lachnospiraceae bacterium]|nr:hypothetical protein [Lachnospiraceae bacterium]
MSNLPIVSFLIVFPMIVALFMLLIPVNEKANRVRNTIAYFSAVLIMGGVAVLIFQWGMNGFRTMDLFKHTETVDQLTLLGEVVLMIVVTFLAFKYQ